MGFQWFLLLLFCFLCDWLFTDGNDNFKKINDIKNLVVEKNRTAEAIVTWIAYATENDTNNVTAVTSRAPIQHAISLAPPARVIVQTSALQVVLTSTIRQQLKQEGRGMQISNVFPALSSPRQRNNNRGSGDDFSKKENLSVSPSSIVNGMETKMAVVEVDEFDEAEDTHFLYYIVVFGAIVVCMYVALHNKKKILGFIIEGRRPSNNTRRATLRYRRLSQHDDSGSDPTNMIY